VLDHPSVTPSAQTTWGTRSGERPIRSSNTANRKRGSALQKISVHVQGHPPNDEGASFDGGTQRAVDALRARDGTPKRVATRTSDERLRVAQEELPVGESAAAVLAVVHVEEIGEPRDDLRDGRSVERAPENALVVQAIDVASDA
jgi:hypothetical protein